MGSAPGDLRCGAGNPVNPDGYNTDYFWKEVLKPDRFLEIIGYYMFVEETRRKEHTKKRRTNSDPQDNDFPPLPPAGRRDQADRNGQERRPWQ